MSDKIYSPEEAATILLKTAADLVKRYELEIQDLRKRELAKQLIPPHKHNVGSPVSAAVEDVPPSKLNAPGKDDKLVGGTATRKQEALERIEDSPEETSGEKSPSDLCKKCGKSHGLEKGCDGMDKAELVDAKGKRSSNSEVSDAPMPEESSPAEHVNKPTKSDPGSGGVISKGKKLGKTEQLTKGKIPNPNDVKSLGTGDPTFNEPYEHGLDSDEPQKGTCGTCGAAGDTYRYYDGYSDDGSENPNHCINCLKSKIGNSVGADRIRSTPVNYTSIPTQAGLERNSFKQEADRLRRSPHQVRYQQGLQGQRINAAVADAAAQAGPWKTRKSELAKAATPPMAKPPSGTNMATKVPTSAPKAPVAKDEMPDVSKVVVPKSQKPKVPSDKRDYTAQVSKEKTVYKPKPAKELEKGVMADIAQRESMHAGAPKPKDPGANVKLPSQTAQAARQADFSAALAGEFQPKPAPKAPTMAAPAKPAKPVSSLASPKAAGIAPKSAGPVMNAARPTRPGIFGKLFGKK